MATNQIEQPFTCGGITCDARRLTEVDSERVMVLVARDTIGRVTLKYGFAAPHPILLAGIGVILVAIGGLALAHLFYWMQHGGLMFEAEAAGFAAAPIGAWLLYAAFRRRIFLEVESTEGRKRLTFTRRTTWPAAQAFADSVERLYGICIDRESAGAAVAMQE